MGKANASLVPPTSPYYKGAIFEGYVHDPERARALLAEAGYDGATIQLIANTRYPNSYDAAVIAREMLSQAGINAELEVMAWGAQFDHYLAGTYMSMSFPYSARFDPALAFDSVIGNKDAEPRKPWDDAEAQGWKDEALKASDPALRQGLFDRLHARFVEEVPFILLYDGLDVTGHGSNVKGYSASIFAMPRLFLRVGRIGAAQATGRCRGSS